MGADLRPTGFLHDRQPFTLGPFTVTPYLSDHSAFDAYGLLIEADRRRLYYSGDLRGHGRKRRVFERMLADPPRAHTLLLEGTRIAENPGDRRGLASEAAVEDMALDVFRRTDGIAFVIYSPQNIDRLVSLYRAAKRADRIFVLDLYGATIAAATGRPETIPQSSWPGVGVFITLQQRIRVKEAGEFGRIAPIRSARLYPEDLSGLADRLVLSFRGSMASELERAKCLEGASALWSLWPGYLDQPSGRKLRRWLDQHVVPLTLAHASGHATVADLQRLVTAMRPERIVPIHTCYPELFEERFLGTRVELHQRRRVVADMKVRQTRAQVLRNAGWQLFDLRLEEEALPFAYSRNLLREALEPDALELARRGMVSRTAAAASSGSRAPGRSRARRLR